MDLRYLRYLRYMANLKSLVDMRDLTGLTDLLDLMDLTDMGYLMGQTGQADLRGLINLADLTSSLCNILGQETERPLAVLALYSIVSAIHVPGPLQQQIEQSLRQIMGQAPLEQRLLINALRQRLGTAASPSPGSTLAASVGTADERAHRLNQLNERGQRNQLQRVEEEELLAACYDSREVSEHAWKTSIGESFFWRDTVAQLAWPLLAEQWNMMREAWQDVVTRLDDEDALMCGAAALLLRKGRNIPLDEREQAIKRIQAILNDEMRSHRPLGTPDGRWPRLDDVLFDTLQALTERG